MQERSPRKRLLLIFIITSFAITLFGFTSPQASKVGLVIVGCFVATIITASYYGITVLVRGIYARYGDVGAEKLKYVLAGALLMNLMPVIGVIELWPLIAL